VIADEAFSFAQMSGAGLGILGLSASMAVGLVFMLAGAGKLRHRDLFPGVVANYRLLPASMVAPVAAVLPVMEMIIGANLLVRGMAVSVYAATAMALLLIFAAAMAINIARGRRHIDCGCGRSQLRQPLSWLLVGRNVLLAAILVPGLLPAPAPGLAEYAIALAGGLAIFVIVQLFNAIGALAASPLATPRR
jgi:hypothetical protein